MSRRVDAVVVGSGPGGSVTADGLAAAGLDVLVLEEGPRVAPETQVQYSLDQMAESYRNAGLTAALGAPTIAYTEGCVVGGGSEVNSGLYHRPSAQLLADWTRTHRIEDLAPEALLPHHRRVEESLGIDDDLGAAHGGGAGRLLRDGADTLGWHAVHVPRAARASASGTVERQTMSRTYLARAEQGGVEVQDSTRVVRVLRRGARAVGVEVVRRAGGRDVRELLHADVVFVCGGTIQTPALLQRSGWRRHVGGNLSVHPTVKVVAELPEHVDDLGDLGEVASVQVREFAPWLSFGSSASTHAMVALALSENWDSFGPQLERWQRLGVHYAAIQTTGRGRVQAVPGRRDPVVTYRLSALDRARLRSGLARLMHLLLAGGSPQLLPAFSGARAVTGRDDAVSVAEGFRPTRSSLMTVHLAGTVPMGEDRDRCGADSFGALHDAERLWVNDASLLPWAPGINPQGTLMAIAHRNVARFLADQGAR
ncbi:GMC family oxidoreductase N-terminal domain-containing protein [Nocardioides zeicaulis]|uniref:GMC family oxidoreductase N-terminal domain-containing protein n=1 Tax=Nocardioides zeicaulis TaxID=1776857 RepID=A0ABV6E7P7_9ACTN